MERRKFLKYAGLISIGGILLPTSSLVSCKRSPLFESSEYSGKVIVIGAGAAGLYAAYLLKSNGINVKILEASDKYGGRLDKLTGFADFPIDLGAQWLHGKNNILGDLITKSGSKITLDDGEEFFWFKNEIVSSLPNDIVALFEKEDGATDISFKDFATQNGFGSEYDYIVEGIAGDSGASAANISALGKIQEEDKWNSGDDDFKFQETFYDLIDQQIAIKIKENIILNTVVSSIDYTSDNIIITDSNNNTFEADKIIITVPITILKSNSINFNPILNSSKTNAFAKIGMEAGMKVFLKFSKKFYNQNIVGGKICAAYADESIGKLGSNSVLLAFVMGEQAVYLSTLGSNDEITFALLNELDEMYNGQASSNFIESYVQDWSKNPFVQGAYSYSKIGIGNAREIASQSIDGKLFFAGEAMNNNGHHQTVHGAIETGYREVLNLLKTI